MKTTITWMTVAKVRWSKLNPEGVKFFLVCWTIVIVAQLMAQFVTSDSKSSNLKTEEELQRLKAALEERQALTDRALQLYVQDAEERADQLEQLKAFLIQLEQNNDKSP